MTICRLPRLLATSLFLLLALCCQQASAALQAQIDRNPVSLNDTINLVIETDESLSGDPDLSALKSDFEVLGQNKSSSLQIVNGRASRSIKWQVGLMAKHAGQLVIPPISVDGQTSAPINVKVVEANQAQAGQEQQGDLFVEVTTDQQSPYVQQQVLLTVRLYSALNFGNASLSDPSFPNMDAIVQKVGDDHDFQTDRHGKPYRVIERHYAIFPQKSGQFTSDAIVFDGNVVDPNQNNGAFSFGPFAQAAHHARVRSNTVALTVKPAPANYTGDQWLPTNKLQLSEKWSADPATFSVGEPITRTLEESASGLTAAQLPALTTATTQDGFKLYPDQAQLADDKSDSGIVGKRVQKIAYIPTRAGTVTLPVIEVKWWDATSGKEQVATLPAHTFTVLPGKPQAGSSPAAMTPASDASAPAPDSNVGTSTALASSLPSVSAGWWPWLSLFLAIGWIVTLLLWWRSSRTPAKSPKSESVVRPIDSKKDVLKQLKKSCDENDAARSKALLLRWASLEWPQDPPVSLNALGRRCHADVAQALTQLDRTLYAGTHDAWQGATLWDVFQAQSKDAKAQAKPSSALNPLYPS